MTAKSNDQAIEEARSEIDLLDQQLISLLNQRFVAIEKLGALKRQQGLPIFQPERWENSRQRRRNLAIEKKVPLDLVESIWTLIHQAALDCQMQQDHEDSTPDSNENPAPRKL